MFSFLHEANSSELSICMTDGSYDDGKTPNVASSPRRLSDPLRLENLKGRCIAKSAHAQSASMCHFYRHRIIHHANQKLPIIGTSSTSDKSYSTTKCSQVLELSLFICFTSFLKSRDKLLLIYKLRHCRKEKFNANRSILLSTTYMYHLQVPWIQVYVQTLNFIPLENGPDVITLLYMHASVSTTLSS